MADRQIGVGLLAYGAIGDEHNQAISSTAGLTTVAVCDAKAERIEAALKISPNAKSFGDADQMLESGLLELVIISTPPNTHFTWAKKALELGINVIVEKPMALTTNECDELIELAKSKSLLLTVYQNRRYDSDFLTMQKAINDGLIGDLFYIESFVGGYKKPCSLWHSDVLVSGGAIFDWGAHFIDQIVTLISSPIAHISGLNQKRHWHHITNADHSQVVITFTDSKQAIFTNSDLAAARKPKYYALGTKGALVGNWNSAAGDTPADLPAIISLIKEDGEVELLEEIKAEPYAFHKAIADHLLNGAKMAIRAEQSRNVVEIMARAEQSAALKAIAIEPELLKL